MQHDPIDIGFRLEPLFDDFLIEQFGGGAALRLHEPTPQDIVFVCDRPWEGNMSGYISVFQDDGRYRMYYKGWQLALGDGQTAPPHDFIICYAESEDGIRWHRPNVGLFEFGGSRDNNIVWTGNGDSERGGHGFAPFRDTNPDCPPDARYKAVGGTPLYAMKSSDGVRWSMLQDEPVITDGAFDSQNLAFWDAVRGEYRAYIRDFRDGCRDIRTATSPDFIRWTVPEWLDYPGSPNEQLYTNQIIPYYRAPHVFVGFPTRYVERKWSEAIEDLPEKKHRRLRSDLSERYGTALSDGLFMSSRDGRTFRRWGEAFIRPGPQVTGNWTYGDNYQNWGIVETASSLSGAPRELSFYATENYWRGPTQFRRYTVRMDGFVSVRAPLAGGEVLTRPLSFRGSQLALNFSASAAGSVQVEVRNANGSDPINGFALDDCVELLGDDLARTVRWRTGSGVSALAGQPVRLRFVLRDADLYSLRFC